MLQPALNTPALNPGPQVSGSPASYGSLIAATRDAVDRALAASSLRQPNADAALPELLGNERFVRNASNHLRLMMDLAGLRVDAVSRIALQIDRRSLREAPPGMWMDAAASLGAAHDLISTHLDAGIPRTAEAVEKLLGPPAASACRTVTELILDSLSASENLIHQCELAHRRGSGHPLPSASIGRFRTTNSALSVLARAAMWDLTGVHSDTAPSLETLEVALPTDLAQTLPPTAATSLAALRVLRQLVHDQARASAPASPASLRDLARLGVRLNDPELVASTEATSPLERLQRAHAIDQVDAARTAWSAAATELTTTVQGTTKAPATYAAAVRTLLEEPLDPRTQAALMNALPSLGRDATRTLERLAQRGELVTLQPIPLQTRKAWRPITLEHKDLLADRFTAAASASARAATAIQDFHRPTTTLEDRSSRDVQQRQRVRVQHQTRGTAR